MQMKINCYPTIYTTKNQKGYPSYTIHIIAIAENKMYGILESSSQIKMLGQEASDGD